MKMNDKETTSTTQFNMSLATLERINELLVSLNMMRSLGRIYLCRNLLLQLYKELYPFLNTEDREYARKNLFEPLLNYDTGKDKESTLGSNLNNMEFWMRDKLHEKGLLMLKSDDPGLALGR